MTDELKQASIAAFSNAMHFQCAAHLALGNIQIAGGAVTTNLAFSCELYLKAALIAEGQNAHGHRLDVLFSRLPVIHAKEIERRYNDRLKDGQMNLRDSLTEVGDAFLISRYVHERDHTKIRVGVIGVIVQILVVYLPHAFSHFEANREHQRFLAGQELARISSN